MIGVDTLRFMAAEARELRPGGETVITRLADILVIQAIRSWIARDPAAQTGWLGALRDQQIGRAIALVHRDPVAQLDGGITRDGGWDVAVGVRRPLQPARWRAGGALRGALEDVCALMWLKEENAALSEIASRY